MSEQDDVEGLEDFDDSELFRALTAPGTAEELEDEQAMLEAFRTANRRRGTLVRRIGIGGASAVLAVSLTGGVAAAYTGSLPAPVQHFAHRTFFVLGIPDRIRPSGIGRITTAPPTSSSPPSRPSNSPSPTTSPTSSPKSTSQPSSSTTESSSPTFSPTTSPTTAPVTVASVGITVSDRKVDEGQTVAIAGRLTDAEGNPLAGRRVALTMKTSADAHPTVIAHKRSGAKGLVGFTSPALVQDARFRLVTKGAHSTARRVVVRPTLIAQYSSHTIEITTNAHWAGESVVVRTRADGVVATVTLDANGQAQLPIALKARKVRYVVRLAATREHAAALTSVVAPSALSP